MTYMHVLLTLNIVTLLLVAHLWWVTQKWHWDSKDTQSQVDAAIKKANE